jgi:hypothetical protein
LADIPDKHPLVLELMAERIDAAALELTHPPQHTSIPFTLE